MPHKLAQTSQASQPGRHSGHEARLCQAPWQDLAEQAAHGSLERSDLEAVSFSTFPGDRVRTYQGHSFPALGLCSSQVLRKDAPVQSSSRNPAMLKGASHERGCGLFPSHQKTPSYLLFTTRFPIDCVGASLLIETHFGRQLACFVQDKSMILIAFKESQHCMYIVVELLLNANQGSVKLIETNWKKDSFRI